MYIIWEA